ncbi:MAG: universal stress protein [Acidimicrobiia bacterium]
MFDHVVVPIDFSPESEQALPHAVEFARRAQLPVELLSVATKHHYADAAERLRQLAEDQGAGAWTVIETEDPAEQVLFDKALTTHGALWFVGSHARTSLGELLLGSVSEDLVRDVERPMVVVGPKAVTPRSGNVLAVALDGTVGSEAVLPAALELARRFNLELRLLQMATTEVPTDVAETSYLARVAARLGAPGCRDYDVLHGKDAAHILGDYVEAHEEVLMLAMATHGVPAGAPRLIAGSTAFDTTRRLEVPVLVYHPASEPAAEVGRPRVVVGVDTMGDSAEAVMWAADEAALRNLPLVIVHAWIYPAYAASPYAYPIGPDIEVVRDAAKQELADAVQAVKDRHPELAVDGILAEDTPGHQLVDQSVGADLLVVGSHHRGRLSEFLGLSVSATCAQRADCPVIIVPCVTPA